MNSKTYLLTPLLILLLLLTGCNRKQIVIGASFSGNSEWSQQLFKEIEVASYQHPNVGIDILNAKQDVASRYCSVPKKPASPSSSSTAR